MRYMFGDYILDTERAELQGAGAPIPLRRKAFQVLVYLLTHRERVVPKQELLEQLWPEQFVGDEVLKACIQTLRKALGESGRTPRCVRTLHGQGYRFVAPVAVREPLPADAAPPALIPPGVREGGSGDGAARWPLASALEGEYKGTAAPPTPGCVGSRGPRAAAQSRGTAGPHLCPAAAGLPACQSAAAAPPGGGEPALGRCHLGGMADHTGGAAP